MLNITINGESRQFASALTVGGLVDTQAYRVTLVVADNVTVDGISGAFVDGDMNGAADAGASEAIVD